MNKQFKFAIYTSFYNASRYIDRIYENIFRKMAENLKKVNEYKRMAEKRLYEAINAP